MWVALATVSLPVLPSCAHCRVALLHDHEQEVATPAAGIDGVAAPIDATLASLAFLASQASGEGSGAAQQEAAQQEAPP